jgi:hypothetical protein
LDKFLPKSILAFLQKGSRVVMLERSEASGGGVFIDIYTFLHLDQFKKSQPAILPCFYDW